MSQNEQPLFSVPKGVRTRWATAENPHGEKGAAATSNEGRKGMPAIRDLAAGAQITLAHVTGSSGIVRRIWLTFTDRNAATLRGLRLDIFWDNCARPAVSTPVGDFFGHVLGRMMTFNSSLLSSPEGKSCNCVIPMPFRSGMKIVLTNETNKTIEMVFYEVDYTIGDLLDEDAMYFHAHWRREPKTVFRRDFEILPRVQGRGRYLATMLGVIANMGDYGRSWWGEGEMKIFLDGDQDQPTLCGTGTEDYIGAAWGQGRFDHPYQGCHLADDVKFWYGFYRQHVPDPIYFAWDIRVTIQQIGCWDPASKTFLHHAETPIYSTNPGRSRVDLSKNGGARNYDIYERENDDWSSCAYFYLDRPENDLPALMPFEQRIAGI